jgi:HEAT repeat protein
VRTLSLITLALAAASTLFVLVLIGRRVWLSAVEGRQRALRERLRPVAIALVEADGFEPPALRPAEAEVFAELLARYFRSLRGPARQRITAYFEDNGAVDVELRRLGGRRRWRRATAAFALGDMGSQRAVSALLRALEDGGSDVRTAAARSLGRLGSVEAIEPLIAASVHGRAPRAVANAALLEIGPPAVPRLVELTAHADPEIRADALDLLGLLGTAAHARVLPERLRDSSARVRAATAGTLGRLGGAEARTALIGALDDRVPFVRAAAARALGQIGGRQAAGALLRVAREDRFVPAQEAARALVRIDPSLVARVADAADAGPHLREAGDLAAL